MKKRFFYAMLLATLSSFAHAINLEDAYRLAQQNDATFKAQQKAFEGIKENKNIAGAALLPNISISYTNTPYNRQHLRSETRTGQKIRVKEEDRDYKSYSGAISLKQALFDYDAIMNLKSSNVQVALAEDNLREQASELIVRVTEAYLNAAYTEEKLTLIRKQLRAYQDQLTINSRIYQLGEGTRIDVIETQTQLNGLKVKEIEAQNALDRALQGLENSIGEALPLQNAVNKLRKTKSFSPLPLAFQSFDEWQQHAMKNSPQLQALQKQVQLADYDVSRKRGNHLPKVELYASRSLDKSSTNSTLDQRYDTESAGVRVSMPIFAGNAIIAGTRQAKYRYEQTLYERKAQQTELFHELKQYFNRYMSAQNQIHAYEKMVAAAELQVTAMKRSVKAGQRSNFDVLNANQQLFQAYHDLAFVKYEHIKTWLGLLHLSGDLNADSLRQITVYFN